MPYPRFPKIQPAQRHPANRRAVKRRGHCFQALESRRVLAASLGWDGPGLGSAELTYHISNSPSSLSQAETNAAIETALDAWASVADITFSPTNQAGLPDSIDLSFVPIDGAGGTLARAYFPDDVNPARIAGDVQFDISDAWEAGNDLANQAFDLVYVAVHEIGHALGLDHVDVAGSVLEPFVTPNESFLGLDSHDITAIQQLYAVADEAPTIATTTDDDSQDDTPSTDAPTNEADTGSEVDANNDPSARDRWRRISHWRRWGERINVEISQHNYADPTDANLDGKTSALDALMIVNRLQQSEFVTNEDSVGLCDANGDGTITASDALTVINSLRIAANDVTVEVVSSAGASEAAYGTEGESSDTIPLGDESVDTASETTDLHEDSHETEVSESPEIGNEGLIDDGGLIDDTSGDSDSEMDSENQAQHLHRRRIGLFGRFPLDHVATSLISRFDTNDDAALAEEEVPMRLWEKLLNAEVDADVDGLITLEEIQEEILRAREAFIDRLDTDANGLLSENEVSERFWARNSAADVDSDGGVSLDELEAFKIERHADRNEVNATQTERDARAGRRHPRLADEVFAAIGRATRR